MKYRHSFHAGNFADVHKHVTLLALCAALQRKDKGFLYLDTHAGRGRYDLSSPNEEATGGIVRLLASAPQAQELRAFCACIAQLRATLGAAHAYPGSPLIAVATLREQDRAVLIELQGAEASALQASVSAYCAQRLSAPTVRTERGDGFARLKAYLPPPERRALTLIDPPYEAQEDFAAVQAGLQEALRRFPTGVALAWYPIKEQSTSDRWARACARALGAPVLTSELWLFPPDSRVGLNGSGLLIVNPPHLTLTRTQVWLPELQTILSGAASAGSRAQMLSK